jgi:hypothetical protein
LNALVRLAAADTVRSAAWVAAPRVAASGKVMRRCIASASGSRYIGVYTSTRANLDAAFPQQREGPFLPKFSYAI